MPAPVCSFILACSSYNIIGIPLTNICRFCSFLLYLGRDSCLPQTMEQSRNDAKLFLRLDQENNSDIPIHSLLPTSWNPDTMFWGTSSQIEKSHVNFPVNSPSQASSQHLHQKSHYRYVRECNSIILVPTFKCSS